MVKCVQPPSCWGIDCNLDLTFLIPMGNVKITKHVPFWFKMDPCKFAIDIGFGTRTLLKTFLLQYEFGMCFLNIFIYHNIIIQLNHLGDCVLFVFANHRILSNSSLRGDEFRALASIHVGRQV